MLYPICKIAVWLNRYLHFQPLAVVAAVYLRTKGEDAQEHGIKGELERLKTTMMRVKDMQDSAKASKVDRPAAHRMVSKSLWQAKGRPQPPASEYSDQ